jgi:hypothetical protein
LKARELFRARRQEPVVEPPQLEVIEEPPPIDPRLAGFFRRAEKAEKPEPEAWRRILDKARGARPKPKPDPVEPEEEEEEEPLKEAAEETRALVPWEGHLSVPIINLPLAAASGAYVVDQLNTKHAVIGSYGNRCAVLGWELDNRGK